MTFTELAAHYCRTQESTPEELRATLLKQIERYAPVGFMLLRCEMFDSHRFGSHTILPYGPNNTHKEPPGHPISPRGLASDMSTVAGTVLASDV